MIRTMPHAARLSESASDSRLAARGLTNQNLPRKWKYMSYLLVAEVDGEVGAEMEGHNNEDHPPKLSSKAD